MTDHMVQTLADATAPELVTELPGPEARRVIEQDLAVTSPSMPRVYPLVPRRAEGCVIEDVDGNRFLDLNAGIAVTATGHCHPAVVAAIEEQARRMLHYCSSDFYHPVYSELCQRLAALAPFGGAPARVFLGNSGTEAVEAAIKLARYHTGRAHLVAFLGGFHGRTMGSLSLTASKARYRAGFGPLLPGVQHVPYGMAGLEQLQTQLFRHLVSPEEVAAIVVEPVQGEGGYVPAPAGFLAGLRALCDEHGILLVADEVQSGIGRTGQFWAIEHDGVAAGHRPRRQGPGQRPAARRHHRPGRRDDVAARHPRLHLRRQPGLLRGRAGHDRSGRVRPGRRGRRARRAAAARACRRSWPASRSWRRCGAGG